MATPTSAFPSGVYATYKRATQFFLEWLVRAGRDRSVTTLAALDAVVRAIADAPATQLSPTLLHQLPRALAACQAAIVLRERVTQYFAGAGAADNSHAHFLSQLKTWHTQLQRVAPATATSASSKKDKKKKKPKSTDTPGDGTASYANYYDVLRLPDDYFVDDDDTVAPAISMTPPATVDRDALWQEAFDHDLQMELACLLMELGDMDYVYETYREVKRETRTLVEATAVATAAMEIAQARVAALQLRYPSIKEAPDVLTLLDPRATEHLHKNLANALHAMARGPTIEHLPGLFLADFVWVGSALLTFTSAIPTATNEAIVLKDGYFGETYDEERTQHYVLPDISSVSLFFMQQLPLLYNARMASRLGNKAQPPPSGLWALLDVYFTTHSVGIPLVFACICWVKSVTALQGNGGLRRHTSLALSHAYTLEKRLAASVAIGHVAQAAPKLHAAMASMLEERRANREALANGSARGLLRTNPLLAGNACSARTFGFSSLAASPFS